MVKISMQILAGLAEEIPIQADSQVKRLAKTD